MIISCKLCGETIHFSNNIVSQRSGKKIPLSEGSDDPHQCEQWKALHRKYHNCNDCGAPIYFDDKNKSKNGKYIPLSKMTGEPHQCDEIQAQPVPK